MSPRRAFAVLAVAALPGWAWAQDQSAVVVPPAPPVVSSPALAPAPPAASAALAPAATGSLPVTPDLAPTAPNIWVPAATAVLGVLNEADGSTSQLSVPVGGQATAGDLAVSIQACEIRPAGQIPDAAVFLTVQPAGQSGGAPLYHGWMVRSAPGAAVVGNAAETFRVIGCA